MKRASEVGDCGISPSPENIEDGHGHDANLEPVVKSWGFYCLANLAGWTQEDVERLAAELGFDPQRIQSNAKARGAGPGPGDGLEKTR